MPVGDRKDPFRSYNFLIEIDGITRAGFRECSGLQSSQDTVEYRDGNEGPTPRKLPGLVTFSNITLHRGLTDDTQLWEWREKAMTGKTERKNGSIVILDETGTEKVRWNFTNAWPVKWVGPALNGTVSDVAIETLEITHEGVKKG